MKNLFPGYSSPTEAECVEAFKDGIITFDTNVLLNVYRLSVNKSGEFIAKLKQLIDKLWLTHHAAAEFMLNRVTVIREQRAVYDEMKDHYKQMVAAFKGKFRRHPMIPIDRYIEQLDRLGKEIDTEVDALKAGHDDLTHDDPALDQIDIIFTGRIGSAPSKEDHSKMLLECEGRFKAKTPPGYMDKDKPDPERYGDAVIWLQLIDHVAKNGNGRPVIFVTEENKEDWWHREDGQTIRPRPELISEMHKLGKAKCLIFKTETFLKYAATFLKEQQPKELIKEVQAVEQEKSLPQVVLPVRHVDMTLYPATDYAARNILDASLARKAMMDDETRRLAGFSKAQRAFMEEEARRLASVSNAQRAFMEEEARRLAGVSNAQRSLMEEDARRLARMSKVEQALRDQEARRLASEPSIHRAIQEAAEREVYYGLLGRQIHDYQERDRESIEAMTRERERMEEAEREQERARLEAMAIEQERIEEADRQRKRGSDDPH